MWENYSDAKCRKIIPHLGVDMNFSKTLIELMTEKEVDSKQLAFDLGVTQQTVNHWKANRHGIELAQLIKLCRYFGCSLEYLAGRTQNFTKPGNFAIQNFGTQLRAVMQSKNISSYTLRKETTVSGKHFYTWDRGASPKLSTLIELAKYFDCSIDELVGLE